MTDIIPEPDRRRFKRRKDDDLTIEQQIELIEQQFVKMEDKQRNFFTKALIAFAVIGIACAVALGGFTVVLKKQSAITDDIQQQRYDSLLESCNGQNKRHDDAVEAAANLDATAENIVVLMVDVLQPYTADCAAFAASKVTG